MYPDILNLMKKFLTHDYKNRTFSIFVETKTSC